MQKTIAIASDHAGVSLKASLATYLRGAAWDVSDLGPDTDESVDYPDFAAAVARAVAHGEAHFGLLVCGSGIGMAIAANKIAGIRAAVCPDPATARMTRAHNDANVLCLGARSLDDPLARAIAEAFLEQPFEGGRHARRVKKIRALEGK